MAAHDTGHGMSIPPVKKTPANSATNRARPMPSGAMKVPLCFSAASMKMVSTSSAVRNISMTIMNQYKE